MGRKIKLLLLVGCLVLLAAVLYAGWKKSPTTDPVPETPRWGILDIDKAMHAHPRYNELQKLNQEIAKVQADAARSANNGSDKPSAGMQGTSIAAQENAGFQQALGQQIDAQLAQKRSELTKMLDAKVSAIKQDISRQLDTYAKELDKTYQPEILSLQLKLKTVQMAKAEQDAVKKQLDALQAERAQKLQNRQAELEKDLRPKMEEEQKNAEVQLREFHTKLVEEANSQLTEKRKEMEARRPDATAGMPDPSGDQQNLTELQALQQQREKLRQLIIKDLKDITAKIAAKANLEVVIVDYQQNIRAIDLTEQVIAEIKK